MCILDTREINPIQFFSIFKNIKLKFTINTNTLQVWILRPTIGIRRQPHGLYHLSPSTLVCVSTISPMMIHEQLGYPRLTKL